MSHLTTIICPEVKWDPNLEEESPEVVSQTVCSGSSAEFLEPHHPRVLVYSDRVLAGIMHEKIETKPKHGMSGGLSLLYFLDLWLAVLKFETDVAAGDQLDDLLAFPSRRTVSWHGPLFC